MAFELPTKVKSSCKKCLGCVADARDILKVLPEWVAERGEIEAKLDGLEADARTILGEQTSQGGK